jgi:hypothetical protein
LKQSNKLWFDQNSNLSSTLRISSFIQLAAFYLAMHRWVSLSSLKRVLLLVLKNSDFVPVEIISNEHSVFLTARISTKIPRGSYVEQAA